MPDPGGLGRRVPTDWNHVDKYPMRLMAAPLEVPETVERILSLPNYRVQYDQGQEGACVGFGSSWMMSILNRHLYDARRLYLEAQKIDEWSDTPPEEGTSVRAAMDVLRQSGHWQWLKSKVFDTNPDLRFGISENRWATTVDEMRACIAAGIPVTIGTTWYQNFDKPQKVKGEYWIGRGELGRMRGCHCTCIFGASDLRQAFRLVNNWGTVYPLVWLPYPVMRRLLSENGEATIVTDRV